MLKFIKHHMDSIDGIGIYPVISFLIFGLFFVAMLYMVIRMTKEEVNELKNYPFDEL
jgi:cytochrome c oxidase cbb3-type subunit IV